MPDAGAPARPATTTAPTTAATEIVHRPDPGLGRGVWEAPSWAFYALGAAVVVAAVAYFMVRLGIVRRKRKSP